MSARPSGDSAVTATSGVIMLQPVLLQLHVADDVGTQRSGGVRQRGAAEAGMKFFGDGGAAGLRAALEHQRLVSGLGQIERGDQSVVAAADDDDVALPGTFAFRPCLRRSLEVFQNFQRCQPPGPPMMPPPGCVADPHM